MCLCFVHRKIHPTYLTVWLTVVSAVFQEELRISSVYSVGGGNAFAPPTSECSFYMCCIDVLVA